MEIFDPIGNSAVEVDIVLRDGSVGRAAVSSGASTGEREALELRDCDAPNEYLGDDPQFAPVRYGGKGVLAAVHNINAAMGPGIVALDAADQGLGKSFSAL
jgi:enolase